MNDQIRICSGTCEAMAVGGLGAGEFELDLMSKSRKNCPSCKYWSSKKATGAKRFGLTAATGIGALLTSRCYKRVDVCLQHIRLARQFLPEKHKLGVGSMVDHLRQTLQLGVDGL